MNERLIRETFEAKRRLEGIVESVMDAIITIDEQQLIVLFNPAAESMFGLSRHEALGQPISRLVPLRFRDGHDEHISRFRQTGVTGRRMGALGAISGLRADGEEFPIEASISQMDVEGARLATVILRDITERIANEESRLVLAREVDHRAKNALAVVQALVSLTTASTIEGFAEAIRGRIAALGRAHNLLAQNHWQGGDIRQIVAAEMQPFHKPGQLRIAGDQATIAANAVQPFSLFVHELATNAIRHGALSVPEGQVSVAWSLQDDGDVRFKWSESGGPPVVRSGEGFGAKLMATVIKQIGGRLDIDWAATGIEVVARLPQVRRLPAKERQRKVEADSGPQRSCRVLVVEDEMLVAMEMTAALRADGVHVLGPAATLEEAFALLEEENEVDAAVLDINLNGQLVYPVADLLRARNVPFLFCTGYAAMADDNRGGDSQIVHKPTNMRILVDEVHKLCGGSSPQPNHKRAA